VKFTHNIARLLQMNFYNRNGDSAIRFGMPGLRIRANSPILPILTPKLVAMATSIERSEKGGEIGNLLSNTYLPWVFGENRFSRSSDYFAQILLTKKKLTQAEHNTAWAKKVIPLVQCNIYTSGITFFGPPCIGRGECMTRGLNETIKLRLHCLVDWAID